MIFNTSYKDKEITAEIEALVGKPYSVWQRIKLGGIGSMRMIVEEADPKFSPYLKMATQVTQANIELRPHGLLIHLNNVLKVFTWAIPYQQLTLKLEATALIADGEKFIRFRDAYVHNRKFLEKVLRLQEAQLND